MMLILIKLEITPVLEQSYYCGSVRCAKLILVCSNTWNCQHQHIRIYKIYLLVSFLAAKFSSFVTFSRLVVFSVVVATIVVAFLVSAFFSILAGIILFPFLSMAAVVMVMAVFVPLITLAAVTRVMLWMSRFSCKKTNLAEKLHLTWFISSVIPSF